LLCLASIWKGCYGGRWMSYELAMSCINMEGMLRREMDEL
jgi:hypothetical protein